MARLSRRSLFGLMAAAPVVVPVVAAARPIATGGFVRSEPIIWPRAVISTGVKWRAVRHRLGNHGPELIIPLKRDARALFRAIGDAIKPTDAPNDLAIDDRAFGWEG